MSSRRDPQPITLDDVRDWYEAVRESILAYRTLTLADLRGNHTMGNSRFFAMSRDEVENHFNAQLAELEATTMMSLMSSAEAAIRADYLDRIAQKLKDVLSQSYLAFHKSLSPLNRKRPPLDEGILEVMKTSGVMPNHIVGNFRDSLRLRHWLAHGRYWTVNLGRSYHHPEDVYLVAHALLATLPA